MNYKRDPSPFAFAISGADGASGADSQRCGGVGAAAWEGVVGDDEDYEYGGDAWWG